MQSNRLHRKIQSEKPAEATKRVEKQVRGTHADEIETSMMLYMDPSNVNWSLAVRDDNPNVPGAPVT